MNVLKVSLLVAFLSAHAAAFATDSPKVEGTAAAANVRVTRTTTSGQYRLMYAPKAASEVTVRIFDARQNLVYTDRIQSEGGFIRPYNLSNLPFGDYTIAVTDASGTVTNAVSYADEVVASKPFAMDITNVGDTQRYELLVTGQRTEAVYVSVYGRGGELVFNEVIDTPNSFRRTYDFSKLLAYGHTIEVFSNGKTVTKAIK